MKKMTVVGVTLAMLAMAGTAMAINVEVSATIQPECAITGSDDLVFGTLSASMATNVDRSGAVRFWCTTGTNYNVQINGAAPAAGTRTMTGGANSLNYTFTPSTTTTGAGTGSNAPLSYSYQATLTPTQVAPAVAAAYSETLNITINL